MLIEEMIMFYHVSQLKSFSQTAEKLKVSKSYISKHISKLEKDLKTHLLNRSTRQLSLTEAGEVFYQHCQKLFTLAEQSYDAMAHLRQQPSGILKISLPPALALHFSQIFTTFSEDYPEIQLNVILESNIVDIIQQGYDLVLRSAVLRDSELIAQRITNFGYILCASPNYIEKHGVITHHSQLNEHIFASYGSVQATQLLNLSHGKQSIKININSRFYSNNMDFILNLVMAGCCVAVLPEFMTNDAIANNKLVKCLPHYNLPETELYAIYPKREFTPLKVTAFIQLLKKYLTTQSHLSSL